jgi:hypothetical protein
LWIRFRSTRPFAIKILLGIINAISGESVIETFASAMRRKQRLQEQKSIQDYVVVDPADQGQLWLDGIAKADGKIMQFIAVRSGAGYSVEAQIHHVEAVGGIQIMATPLKHGLTASLVIQQLGKPAYTLSIQLNATVYELMTKIAEYIDVPMAQFRLLFNSRQLEPSEYIVLISLNDHQSNTHSLPSLSLRCHNPSKSLQPTFE